MVALLWLSLLVFLGVVAVAVVAVVVVDAVVGLPM